MKHSRISLVIITVLLAGLVLGPSSFLPQKARAQGPAVIGVFSNACGSSNITIANPSCGTLAVGTSISVELNITNAPMWNAYDLFLFYDPHFINATGFSENQTVFTNPFTPVQGFEPGVVHLAATNLDPGHPTLSSTGTIAHIFFKILGSGVSSLTLAAGTTNPSAVATSWTRISRGPTPLDVTTFDGYFKNVAGKSGPVASFAVTPSQPASLDTVTFDARASFDPDASPNSGPGIKYYAWDYGDGTGLNSSNAIVTHAYSRAAYGNFSVRLTVVDLDDGFSAIVTQRLYVASLQVHDISLALALSSGAVSQGQKITVTVKVTDVGTYSENFNLTVFYESPKVILDQSTGHPVTTSNKVATFTYTIDTTDLAPGAYTVSATAAILQDPTPGDNSNQQTFNVTPGNVGTSGPTIIGVWSNTCGSSIITTANPSCGTLAVGTSISVELNITRAPPWNAYELFLYYDPHFINATGFSSNQTVFTNAFTALQSFQPGVIHLAVVNLGQPLLSGTGTIAHIFFRIQAMGVSPLTLAAGTTNPSIHATSFTTISLGSIPLDVTTSDGYFKNVASKLGPVASFTVTPNAPASGDTVTFDASTSFDPDAVARPGIKYYAWDFGDPATGVGVNGTSPIVTHVYSSQAFGNFSVRLIVVDLDDHFEGMVTKRVQVGHSVTDTPPVAKFTFSPPNPTAGTGVLFDGFQSFDPDGSIRDWSWNLGDNSFQTFGPTVNHSYLSPGNYTVTLTVTDNAGLTGSASLVVPVHARLVHDVGVAYVYAGPPSIVLSGQTVNVGVGLVNNGLSSEIVSVTTYYDSYVAASRTGISLPPTNIGGPMFIPLFWDTTGVAPGNYTISATVFLATDQNPADNHLSDGQVTILPPPTLNLTPNSGTLGTEVVVHGTGFPVPQYGPSELFMSFDDQFLGFAFPRNGTFVFTFNVPHADPTKPHEVKALDVFSSLVTKADFHVLAEPSSTGSLAVVVSVGTVYFPGDSAVIYVLTTFKGSPVASGVQVQLIRPSGSSITLTTTSVATGLSKAAFTVPRTGSTGTYAIVATATLNGQNFAALGSFEVKPSWIASQSGRNTTTGLALVGIVGLVAFASWMGYTGRRKEDPVPF